MKETDEEDEAKKLNIDVSDLLTQPKSEPTLEKPKKKTKKKKKSAKSLELAGSSSDERPPSPPTPVAAKPVARLISEATHLAENADLRIAFELVDEIDSSPFQLVVANRHKSRQVKNVKFDFLAEETTFDIEKGGTIHIPISIGPTIESIKGVLSYQVESKSKAGFLVAKIYSQNGKISMEITYHIQKRNPAKV